MANKTLTLRIRAERLGSVEEVRKFLTDLESAYNRIYCLDFFLESISSNGGKRLKELDILDAYDKIDPKRIILPSDQLSIARINIQSPGFWDFLGALNPLLQIREFLKDNHERIKDNRYRSRQEKELMELTILENKIRIINQSIEVGQKLGYSEIEMRPMMLSVMEPLHRLGEHQANGLIDGIEEIPQNANDPGRTKSTTPGGIRKLIQ